MLAASLAALLALPAADTASWYVLSTGSGVAIGYVAERVEPTARGRAATSERQVQLADGLDGKTVVSSRTVIEEDAAGRTVAAREYDRTGRSWRRIEADIGAGEAVVTVQTPADKRTMRVPLPPGVRFDGGEGLLKAGLPRAGQPLAFDDFNLSAGSVDRVTIEAAAAAPAGGRTRILVRKRWDRGALRSVARLTVDEGGRILETVEPSFGTSLRSRLADRETALAPHPVYRPLADAVVKSPVRIPAAAMKGHIRYVLAFRDGIAFDVPETGEQHAATAAEGATVDVCEGCGGGLPTDAAYLSDALRPTAWLQSDAPEIRAIAAPVARLRTSGARKMEMLREKGRPYIERIDFTGHYSALETLSRRAGDCTEAAVLLAALGRAAGIPTRVVNGLVYSRFQYHGVSNAFLPHSWTLAYVDGAWRSFDLALDAFDSTHIALTIGDGDARSIAAASQLAGLLEWKAISEVRTAPAR
jgi:hypothetical protein